MTLFLWHGKLLPVGAGRIPKKWREQMLLYKSSLQKLQVEIHFRLLFNDTQQHWPGTIVWACLWCCSHFSRTCILLPHLTPFSPQDQTATVHSGGYILNQFKNIKWQRPLCLQTSTPPSGRTGVWPVQLWVTYGYLYKLWVLSLYGWNSIFSCPTVNVVIGIYFQHT